MSSIFNASWTISLCRLLYNPNKLSRFLDYSGIHRSTDRRGWIYYTYDVPASICVWSME